MPVTIHRLPRLRRMTLRVRPTGEVVVRAPKRVSDREIEQFIAQHTKWIDKQLQRHASLVPLTHTEISELHQLASSYLPHRAMVLAEQYGFSYQRISCRHQKTRWGSCSHRNSISLNIELMRLPPHLQDYIILHELNHTVHKHHQKPFWNHLDRLLPGAKKIDKELKKWKIGYANKE